MVNDEVSFKKVAHTEQETTCFYDKKHKPSESRTCASVHLTVIAMAKIQAKFGVTVDTVSPQKALVKIFKLVGINLNESDLNRSKSVLNPVVAVSDTTTEFKTWCDKISAVIAKATPEQLLKVPNTIKAIKTITEETKAQLLKKFCEFAPVIEEFTL